MFKRSLKKNLYKMLRILDKKKITTIAVQKIPKKGLGLALNDRLFESLKKIMSDKIKILKQSLKKLYLV